MSALSCIHFNDPTNNRAYDAAYLDRSLTLNGTAQITNSAAKFGDTCIFFPNSRTNNYEPHFVRIYPRSDGELNLTNKSALICVEAWIKLIDFPAGNGTSDSYPIYSSGGYQYTSFQLWVGSTDIGCIINGSTRLSAAHGIKLNEWTHVALVRSSGVLRVLVNGVVVDYENNTTVIDPEVGHYIGADHDNIIRWRDNDFFNNTTHIPGFKGYMQGFRLVAGDASSSIYFNSLYPNYPVAGNLNNVVNEVPTALPTTSLAGSKKANSAPVTTGWCVSTVPFHTNIPERGVAYSNVGPDGPTHSNKRSWIQFNGGDFPSMGSATTIEGWFRLTPYRNFNSSMHSSTDASILQHWGTNTSSNNSPWKIFVNNVGELHIYDGASTRRFTAQTIDIPFHEWFFLSISIPAVGGTTGNTAYLHINGIRVATETNWTMGGWTAGATNFLRLLGDHSTTREYVEMYDYRLSTGIGRYGTSNYTPPTRAAMAVVDTNTYFLVTGEVNTSGQFIWRKGFGGTTQGTMTNTATNGVVTTDNRYGTLPVAGTYANYTAVQFGSTASFVNLLINFDTYDTTLNPIDSARGHKTMYRYNGAQIINSTNSTLSTASRFGKGGLLTMGEEGVFASQMDVSNNSFDISMGTSNFTLEFWFRLTKPAINRGWQFGNDTEQTIVQIGECIELRTTGILTTTIDSITTAAYKLYIGNGGNYTVTGGLNGAALGTLTMWGGTNADRKVGWQHFVLIRNGATFQTFINGVNRHTYTSSNNINLTPTGTIRFGSNGAGKDCVALIDDFRFTNTNTTYPIVSNTIQVPTQEVPPTLIPQIPAEQTFTVPTYQTVTNKIQFLTEGTGTFSILSGSGYDGVYDRDLTEAEYDWIDLDNNGNLRTRFFYGTAAQYAFTIRYQEGAQVLDRLITINLEVPFALMQGPTLPASDQIYFNSNILHIKANNTVLINSLGKFYLYNPKNNTVTRLVFDSLGRTQSSTLSGGDGLINTYPMDMSSESYSWAADDNRIYISVPTSGLNSLTFNLWSFDLAGNGQINHGNFNTLHPKNLCNFPELGNLAFFQDATSRVRYFSWNTSSGTLGHENMPWAPTGLVKTIALRLFPTHPISSGAALEQQNNIPYYPINLNLPPNDYQYIRNYSDYNLLASVNHVALSNIDQPAIDKYLCTQSYHNFIPVGLTNFSVYDPKQYIKSFLCLSKSKQKTANKEWQRFIWGPNEFDTGLEIKADISDLASNGIGRNLSSSDNGLKIISMNVYENPISDQDNWNVGMLKVVAVAEYPANYGARGWNLNYRTICVGDATASIKTTKRFLSTGIPTSAAPRRTVFSGTSILTLFSSGFVTVTNSTYQTTSTVFTTGSPVAYIDLAVVATTSIVVVKPSSGGSTFFLRSQNGGTSYTSVSYTIGGAAGNIEPEHIAASTGGRWIITGIARGITGVTAGTRIAITSTDNGNTWTVISALTTTSVTIGNPKFTSDGSWWILNTGTNPGLGYYSSDGTTWTFVNNSFGGWEDITYGLDRFVAVTGDGGKIARTTGTGIVNWSTSNGDGTITNGIVFNTKTNEFIIIYFANANYYSVSTNLGVSWTLAHNTEGGTGAIFGGNNGFSPGFRLPRITADRKNIVVGFNNDIFMRVNQDSNMNVYCTTWYVPPFKLRFLHNLTSDGQDFTSPTGLVPTCLNNAEVLVINQSKGCQIWKCFPNGINTVAALCFNNRLNYDSAALGHRITLHGTVTQGGAGRHRDGAVLMQGGQCVAIENRVDRGPIISGMGPQLSGDDGNLYFGTQDFTISGWFYFNEIYSWVTHDIFRVCRIYESSTSSNSDIDSDDYLFYLYVSAETLKLTVKTTNGQVLIDDALVQDDFTTINYNDFWTYISLNRSGNQIWVDINGVTVYQSAAITADFGTATGIAIGRSSYVKISDCRVVVGQNSYYNSAIARPVIGAPRGFNYWKANRLFTSYPVGWGSATTNPAIQFEPSGDIQNYTWSIGNLGTLPGWSSFNASTSGKTATFSGTPTTNTNSINTVGLNLNFDDGFGGDTVPINLHLTAVASYSTNAMPSIDGAALNAVFYQRENSIYSVINSVISGPSDRVRYKLTPVVGNIFNGMISLYNGQTEILSQSSNLNKTLRITPTTTTDRYELQNPAGKTVVGYILTTSALVQQQDLVEHYRFAEDIKSRDLLYTFLLDFYWQDIEPQEVFVGVEVDLYVCLEGDTAEFSFYEVLGLPSGTEWETDGNCIRIFGIPEDTGDYQITVYAYDVNDYYTASVMQLTVSPGFSFSVEDTSINQGFPASIPLNLSVQVPGLQVSFIVSSIPSTTAFTYNSATGKIEGSTTQTGTFLVYVTGISTYGAVLKTFNLEVIPYFEIIKPQDRTVYKGAPLNPPITFAFIGGTVSQISSMNVEGLPLGLTFINGTNSKSIAGTPLEVTSGTDGATITATLTTVTGITRSTTFQIRSVVSITLDFNQTTLSYTIGVPVASVVLETSGPTPCTRVEIIDALPQGFLYSEGSRIISGSAIAITPNTRIDVRLYNGVDFVTAYFNIEVKLDLTIEYIDDKIFTTGQSIPPILIAYTGISPVTAFECVGIEGSGLVFDTSVNPPVIRGTPTSAGKHVVTVRVFSGSNFVERSFDINILNPFDIVLPEPTTLERLVAITPLDILISGIGVTVAWNNLPPGITYNTATRQLQGIPNTAGVYLVTATAVNSIGAQLSRQTTLTVVNGSAEFFISPGQFIGITGRWVASYVVSVNDLSLLGAWLPITSGGTSRLPNGVTFNQTTGTVVGLATEEGAGQAVFNASLSGDPDFIVSESVGWSITFNQIVLPRTGGSLDSPTYNINVIRNRPINFTLPIAGDVPVSWALITALPAGLSLETQVTLDTQTSVYTGGRIFGTTQVANGQYPVTIRANAINPDFSATQTYIVNVGVNFIELPAFLTGAGVVGVPVEIDIPLDGEVPTAWQIQSGTVGPFTLDNNGTITGTSLVAGTFRFFVIARAGSITSNVCEVVIDVTGGGDGGVEEPPNLPTAVTINAFNNVPINYTIFNFGGQIDDYQFSVDPPLGISITQTAQGFSVTGTLSSEGTYSLVLDVWNQFGDDSTVITIIVANGRPTIPENQSFSFTRSEQLSGTDRLSVLGNTPASIAFSTLPTGILFNPASYIFTGTAPSTTGETLHNVTATNLSGSTGQIPVKFIIRDVPITIQPNQIFELPESTGSFSRNISTSGGTPTGGSLEFAPSGLQLLFNPTRLSGITPPPGSYNIRVSLTNFGNTATQFVQLIVSSLLPTITANQSFSGTVGSLADFTIVFTGGAPINWGIPVPTQLPSGLTFSLSSGKFTGTPTTSGTFVVGVFAQNAAGVTPTVNVTITINQAVIKPEIPSGQRFNLIAGQQISNLFVQTTGGTPTTWAATGLPQGLAISTTTGQISGTLNASAVTTTSNITASNTAGSSSRSVEFTITQPVAVPQITAGQTFTFTLNTTITTDSRILFTGTGATLTSQNLPSGISMDGNTGRLQGRPLTAGIFNVVITARNSAGTDTKTVVVTVTSAASQLPVLQQNLSPIQLIRNVNMSPYDFINSGGEVETWSAANLPQGLSFNFSTGIISGRPTAVENKTVTVTATNSAGSASTTLAINVISSVTAPVINNQTINTFRGAHFSFQLQATGTITNWLVDNVPNNSLPQGISLSAVIGTVSGIPTNIGTFTTTIKVENEAGSDTGIITIIVASSALIPVITPNQTFIGRKGVNFNYTIGFSNSGGAPTSWRLASAQASLHPGIILDTQNGYISGIPTTAGNTSTQLIASNSAGDSIATTINFQITESVNAPNITQGQIFRATLNSSFSRNITFSGNVTEWRIVSGELPAGLILNGSTGAISGTPTVYSGSRTIRIFAGNQDGSDEENITVAVDEPAIVVSPGQSFNGYALDPFTATVRSQGNPVSWQLTNLPASLQLAISNTGVITGTPQIAGEYTGVVTAVGVSGISGSASIKINILSKVPVITPNQVINLSTANFITYSIAFSSVGGTPPTQWSTLTPLPQGLTLNSARGTVSGTPSQATTTEGVECEIKVENSYGASSEKIKIIVVAVTNILKINPEQTVIVAAGTPFEFTPTYVGVPTRWYVLDMLTGLSINAVTGKISGTLSTPGTYRICVYCENSRFDASAFINIKVN